MRKIGKGSLEKSDFIYFETFITWFQAFWAEHKCFVNMGRHYFNLFYDADADACNADGPEAFTPIQLLYR